jgi:hypothetical protein
MAINTAPQDNYPFSTRDGKVIPLDILRSKSIVFQDFTSILTANITIPVGSSVAYGYATEDCVLVLESSASIVFAPDTPITKGIFFPKDHVVVFAVSPGVSSIKGLTASGRIYLQIMEQWAGLGLDINYRKQ